MTNFKKAIVEKYGKDATIEMLFGILDELPTPLFFKDESLRSIYVNEANAEFNGKSPEDCVGLTDFEFHPKEAAEQYAADDSKLLRSKKPVRKQESTDNYNGAERHFLTHKQSVRFKKDGKTEKIIFCINEDRTELVRKERELDSAKEKLEVSNKRIRQAVDSIESGFVIWDKDDRLVLCNDAFRKQFGFLPNLAEGRPFKDMFLEFAQTGLVKEAVGREEEWVEEHLKVRDKELGEEILFKTHDGNWMMRRDVRNENGDRVGIRTDVTEIQNHREKLELASAALEKMSSAVLVKNADGVMTLVNQRFGELLGFSPAELVGKTAADVFDPEIAEFFESRERKVLQTGETAEFEETIAKPDGSNMDAITSIQRIQDSDENYHICIVVNDVSEIRSREERLEKQAGEIEAHRLRMEKFAETSADWFWEMDADLKFSYLSDGVKAAIGLNPETVIGKSRRQLWKDKEDRDQIEPHLKDLDERKEFKHFTYPMASPKDGSTLHIAVSGTPVFDSDGQFSGYIGTGRDATAQVERQKALEKAKADIELNQKRFKAFAETNSDWFWEMDGDLRFSYFSDSFEAVTGVSPKRLLGKNRQETGIPGISEEAFQAHLKVLQNHEAFRDFIHSRQANDGSEIWLSISGTPVFDSEGKFQGYQGSGRDVTEQVASRKALELAHKELAGAKEKVEAFAEASADWFWEMDADLRFSYFSETYERIAKVDPRTLLGKTRRETGLPGMPEEEFEAFMGLLERHEPYRDKINSRTLEDGSTVWHSTSGSPVFDEDGSFKGYRGTGKDVTHQIRREQELKQSLAEIQKMERIVDATFDNLPVGLSIYDENDRFVRCNTTVAAEVFQIHNDLGPGHHITEALEALYEHEILEKVENQDVAFTNPPEKEAWIEERREFLSLPESESYADVNGRRMRITNRRLENGLFVSLWADVSDMHEATKAAESADRAKSEFLANMSHEIRTPMNGVMGMAELLTKTELDAKQKMFTDVIVKSGASLLTIINDILDFSKLDAGQMELDPAPFNLTEAIEDVATLVSSRVAEKDLELIVRVDPALPTSMIGDVGRIRQIVTNLMGNAVKFTEQGHVYVNVTDVETCLDNGTKRLRFEVTDTGIGIPAEKCRSVFEKFSQVDTSSSRKHEGTGLGLTIASSLVEIMGGEIGVESKVGEGSTFWFEIELPVDRVNKKERHVPVDVTGARVLVVDDNEVNRSILSEQMAAWKFDSAAAVDGFEALAVMKAASEQNITIDCVVLDYHMPGMNGGEVVKRMRADPMMANIPVIMLTSVDQTEDGKVFSSLGIQAHLTKPARSSHLLESIVAILQERAQNGGIAAPVSSKTSRAEPLPDALWMEDTHLDRSATASELETSFSGASTEAPGATHSAIDVLVCEDNEVNQIVFTQILQAANYSFEIAPNGKQGVEMMKRLSPKIILMDVSMPEMNGLEATGCIREYEKGSGIHTPIIGVTAHAIKGDMEKCLAAGMDDYLSKPVSPDRLQEKIANWMNTISDVRQA